MDEDEWGLRWDFIPEGILSFGGSPASQPPPPVIFQIQSTPIEGVAILLQQTTAHHCLKRGTRENERDRISDRAIQTSNSFGFGPGPLPLPAQKTLGSSVQKSDGPLKKVKGSSLLIVLKVMSLSLMTLLFFDIFSFIYTFSLRPTDIDLAKVSDVA
ncbi:hypothetical protein SDJN03_01848, partial [Cucurbita argyrosperma subsp. sororia]